MSRASRHTKLDLLRHTARTNGLYAAIRRTGGLARNALLGRKAAHVYPRVQWGEGVIVRGQLELLGPGTVVIGDHCTFERGFARIATLTPEATVVLGKSVYLNGPSIMASAGIRIGDHCVIGQSVITDSDFHGVRPDQRSQGAVRPVALGNNVWIGAGVLILKGVEVGDNAVIGANTVVRNSIPDGKIVIGNPQVVAGDVSPGDDIDVRNDERSTD
jgi:acetyltransferase-like isoleucine patch superfamily enzyme